jgi:hypothetical protein
VHNPSNCFLGVSQALRNSFRPVALSVRQSAPFSSTKLPGTERAATTFSLFPAYKSSRLSSVIDVTTI